MADASDLKPWDLEPDLAPDRLQWIARQFVAVRRQAVEDFSPAKGDNRWSHGCTCYARQSAVILKAALSGDYPWLRVIDPSLKFVFSVGAVLLRFFKGDVENPGTNLRESFPELRVRQRSLDLGQGQLSLIPANDVARMAWLIAVWTDDAGLATSVSIAAYSPTEELILSYEIPFDEAGALSPVSPLPPPPPVPIAPPSVSAPDEKKATSDDAEGPSKK